MRPSSGDADIQTITISAVSDNQDLLPDSAITVFYNSDDFLGTLEYQPIHNRNGTANITITIKDDGGTQHGGADTLVYSFPIMLRRGPDLSDFAGG